MSAEKQDNILDEINDKLKILIARINGDLLSQIPKKVKLAYNGYALENDVLYLDYLLSTEAVENEPVSINIVLGQKSIHNTVNMFITRYFGQTKTEEKKKK